MLSHFRDPDLVSMWQISQVVMLFRELTNIQVSGPPGFILPINGNWIECHENKT